MISPASSTQSDPCPRCRSASTEILALSPVAGIWVAFVCKTCLYTWRSTEPEENRNPDLYPALFRLTVEDMKKFPTLPEIPSPK